MDYWRNQGYNALHYEQEPFENAVQERQRAAYEQVEIAAAVATRRTAAHMTSSFRDTVNNNREIIARNYFRVRSGTRSSATLWDS